MAEIGAGQTIWTPFEVLSEQLQVQNIIRTRNLIDSEGYAAGFGLYRVTVGRITCFVCGKLSKNTFKIT